MVNSLDYHPCPSRLGYILKDASFHISINFVGLYLSPECLLNFLSNFLYSTMCVKIFQIYGVHIPRKCINSRYFYSCSSPLKTRPQVLAITPKAEGNCSLPQAAFFRKSVSPNSRKGWNKQ